MRRDRFGWVVAVVAWCGVLLQCYLSLALSVRNGHTVAHGLLVYAGYFTVLTNLLVAIVVSLPLVAPRAALARLLEGSGVRTATAAAIALVGLAYFLLLRQVWNPTGLQLVADVILHYVTPALFVAYWFFKVPKAEIRYAQIPGWTLYPLGYFAYMLLRGWLTGMYPYHFLDPTQLGLARMSGNALGVLAGFAGLAAMLCLVAAVQRKRDA